MNSLYLKNGFRFVLLVMVQGLIFNHINLFNYINPFVYILFIILFPVRKNIAPFLILSFLLGLSVDFFSDSGGIHAAASTFIAFIRLPYLNFILGRSDFDYLLFHFGGLPLSKAILYLSGLTFIHHLIVFTLEYFSLNEFSIILSKTLYTGLFTIFLSIVALLLFSKRR